MRRLDGARHRSARSPADVPSARDARPFEKRRRPMSSVEAEPAAWEAGRVGFEPTRPLRACRFSRPVPSTARPPAPGRPVRQWAAAVGKCRRLPARTPRTCASTPGTCAHRQAELLGKVFPHFSARSEAGHDERHTSPMSTMRLGRGPGPRLAVHAGRMWRHLRHVRDTWPLSDMRRAMAGDQMPGVQPMVAARGLVRRPARAEQAGERLMRASLQGGPARFALS